MSGELVPISTAGQGKQGYCKLCSFAHAAALDALIEAKWNASQINDWLQKQHGFNVDRATIYKHQKHVMHPQDRLVTAVQRSEQRAIEKKPVSSNEEFLEAVRNAAYQKVQKSPDEVTVDQGLKAAATLAQRKGQGNIYITLAHIMAGSDEDDDVYEGEAREVQ